MRLRKQCVAPKYVKILELNCEDAMRVFMKAWSMRYTGARGREWRRRWPFPHSGMMWEATLRGGLWFLLRFPEVSGSEHRPKPSPRSWSSVRFPETVKTEAVERAS